jgi:hypothetical protein
MRILQMILLIVALQSVAIAETPGVDWEHRAYLMAGEYIVIGRKPDSKALYSGHISFHANGEKLDFVRTIGQVTVRGTAFIDKIPDINGVFLKLMFVQNRQSFEGRFQFMDGCDSAFRFTGYVGSSGHTRVTGLEAYFPDR